MGKIKAGDRIVDIRAIIEGWEDWYGVATAVDGSMVRVRYDSGEVRWKNSSMLDTVPPIPNQEEYNGL